MSARSLAAAAPRSAPGSGRFPTRSSTVWSAARASASAAAQSARKASSCSSRSTVIGTRPSGSGVVIHRCCSARYSCLAALSPVASWSGSISPAASRYSRKPTSRACISSCKGLRADGSSHTCRPMIPVGSVPVASSQLCTSPNVASCSLILCRIVSADSQNGADNGFPAASRPRLIPGREASASSAGTLSSAIATSRRRRSDTGRWAISATRSAWSSTPRSVRRSRPTVHGPPVSSWLKLGPAAEVRLEHLRHPDLLVLGLVVLDDRGEQPGRRDRGVVQRVGELHRAVRVAVADAGPPRLPVVQRGAAVRLAEAAKRREPGLDVVHPVLARAHVARGDLHDLVVQPEALQQVLGHPEQLGVPAVGFLVVGRADDELLDLLELVHPEQPADVTAGAARLPAEARRDARVADRQRLRVEDLPGVQADEGHLGGAGQVQVVTAEVALV